MAMEHDQMYKEGQVILENALIQRIAENQPDPLKDDEYEMKMNFMGSIHFSAHIAFQV